MLLLRVNSTASNPSSPFPRSHRHRLPCQTLNSRSFLPTTPTTVRFSIGKSSPPFRPLAAKSNPLPLQLPFRSSLLHQVKPYLISEWEPILKGWLCGAVSVYCLSQAVPKAGQLPSVLAAAGPGRTAEVGVPLIALALANCVATYLQQAFLWEAALNAVRKMRVDVFDRVLRRDLGFFEGSGGVPAGDIAYRITAEASDVAGTVFSLLSMMVPDALQLIVMATQMVRVSPVLSLATVMVIPLVSLAIVYLGECLRKISQKAHASVARLSAYLNEVLPSVLFVKSYNGEVKESLRFRNLAEDDLRNLLKKRKMKAFIPQLVQVLYIGGLFLLCAGSVLASRGSFDSCAMVSFVTSLVLLVEPIKGVGKAYNELKQGEPAVQRLFDLTKYDSQVTEKPDAVHLESVAGDIKFCNVTFRYGDNMPLVLNGLNLHIKPKETVALVGPSGGGKTTLVKLLLHLYNPLSGCILLDDHNTCNIQLRSLRKHIGFVSQDIVMFTGSIAENIAYKDSLGRINMEDVKNAAKIANADDFIRTLPDGYETDVGPRGSRLSGGQRQRLAIARALYQKSSILILDEATSALDSRSELLVREALERLMVDHTIVVIAHRMETILMADRILLFEDGRLEEVTKSAFLARDDHGGSLMPSALIA